MKKITIAIIALVASGCASIDQQLSSDAVPANMNAQIIDKTPAEGAPEGDAQIAAAATARYKAGQVKPLEAEASGGGGSEGGQ